MRCPHQLLDGAYVLGALAPAERREFAEHLTGCVQCSMQVRELSGLPGLLARVDLADIEGDPRAGTPPVPPTLLPTLVREARRSRRRRSTVVAAVAAAAAAVVVGGALGVGGVLEDDAVPPERAAPSVSRSLEGTPMVAVAPSPVSGHVLISPLAWGTRVDLTCSYESAADDSPYGDGAYGSAPEYALVVRTRDGRTDEVATWHGLPGRTMRLSAVTATPRSEIAAVEVLTADGTVVLQARL